MINTEERTLTPSPCGAVFGLFYCYLYRRCADLRTPLWQIAVSLKGEPIILCLTYFDFHGTVFSKKYLEEFDGKSIF